MTELWTGREWRPGSVNEYRSGCGVEFPEVCFGGMACVGDVEMVGFLGLDGVAPDADVGHGDAVDGRKKHLGVPVGYLKAFKSGFGKGCDLAALAGFVDHEGELRADASGVLLHTFSPSKW